MKKEIENGMWKLTADEGCVLCNGSSYVDAPVYMKFDKRVTIWFDVPSMPNGGGNIPDSEALKIILGKESDFNDIR